MPLSPIKPSELSPAGQRQPQPGQPRTLRLPFDPLMLLAVVGLGICSVVTLRASTRNLIAGDPSYYFNRQTVYLCVGFVLMVLASRVDYGIFRRWKTGLYVALILSILAVLGAGHSAEGATRAIRFPLFSFQASELGKVLLTLVLAAFLVERARERRSRDTTVRLMIAALIPTMLVIVQPDLGSGLVYMTIAYMMLFIGGAPWKHLAALAALVCVSATFVLVAAPAAGVHLLKNYQQQRLTAFLNPSANPKKEGWQQLESKIAIGSGEKTGRGANSNQTTEGFVPESQTDFVFAAVGERYGFVGAGLVLLLYGLLISRALRVLVMAKDLYGSLIAAGVAAMLMFQVFVNIGMTIGIMPITGVTLPLMSYGGSSVIATMLSVGLLQSIYVRARASAALKGRVPRY
jgi:rod shape determining protein RodA